MNTDTFGVALKESGKGLIRMPPTPLLASSSMPLPCTLNRSKPVSRIGNLDIVTRPLQSILYINDGLFKIQVILLIRSIKT